MNIRESSTSGIDRTVFDSLGPEREKQILDLIGIAVESLVMVHNVVTPMERDRMLVILQAIGEKLGKRAITSYMTGEDVDVAGMLSELTGPSSFLNRVVATIVNGIRGVS